MMPDNIGMMMRSQEGMAEEKKKEDEDSERGRGHNSGRRAIHGKDR